MSRTAEVAPGEPATPTMAVTLVAGAVAGDPGARPAVDVARRLTPAAAESAATGRSGAGSARTALAVRTPLKFAAPAGTALAVTGRPIPCRAGVIFPSIAIVVTTATTSSASTANNAAGAPATANATSASSPRGPAGRARSLPVHPMTAAARPA